MAAGNQVAEVEAQRSAPLPVVLDNEPASRTMRIVVAMSGGVDSSVAAALLAEQGHEVIGLSMQLYAASPRDAASAAGEFGSCCTLDDLQDARRVARRAGFPHYIVNFEREFQETVISNFVREYAGGRTPLPCAHCNSSLKFSTLLERARALDAEHLATGHYAQVRQASDGRWLLARSVDRDKDQSYFLFSLTQDQLARARFPVGGLTKSAVRDEARRLGLAVADKRDSQEICFVPDGDYAAFVAARSPSAPRAGAIRDQHGTTLARHDGVHRFTVGQRKGLGISAGVPLYVLKIDAEHGDVTVGPRAALEQATLTASGVNWIATAPPASWLRVSGQIRHRHQAAPGRVRAVANGRAELEFDAPQPAITPGQAVVFYDDEIVVGGGWIE
jgi:tRNA-specific 2-thiouridylase